MKKFILVITAFAVTITALGFDARAQKTTIHESPHKVLERTCEKCHVATSFKDIRFDHGETGFALGNPHARLKCLDCHSVEDFTKEESSCAGCHTDVHREQMGPRCERCHVGENWSVFDSEEIHSSTNFPLMGRHVILDCESCHAGMPIERFRQTPSRCVDCHRADYESVQSPNHLTSGFSTECETCHQMTLWEPANMTDHDAFFPIFSGAHNRVWSECAQCHPSSGNFRVVDCLTCHDHSQPLMDPAHSGFAGYSYATPACLSCHPRGDKGRFLDHEQVFPIFSGPHSKWDACADCHPSATNKAIFSCFQCHGRTKMDDKHSGENGYSYNSAECLRCHPDGRKN
jgi:hypothetical protein